MSENKHNLFYFEAESMKELFEKMKEWQESNRKRLLSIAIQLDNEKYCCIALSNPTEVVICSGDQHDQATVSLGQLFVDAS